jgi:Fic family protein
LAVVDIVEKRIDDGKGSWRRKGISIADRSLAAWHHSIVLKRPKDYCRFIPFSKNEQFTVRELGEKAGINVAIARKTLYVLAKIGIAERIGKRGNALVYVRQ